jgi:CRP-like cAMP-binding protein
MMRLREGRLNAIEQAELVAEVLRLRQWLFLPVEQRLVDHLASLPGEDQPDGSRKLVRPPRQQDLAESIGCARENVVRAVSKMRRQGQIVYGRMEHPGPRPVVMFLSPALLARAEQIRSAR